MDAQIEDLVLLLLYLTSWEEKVKHIKIVRSWKGYPFEVLNALTEKDYIHGSKRAKSVYLTEQGIKQAKELVRKYSIATTGIEHG
jgi:Mn-dependent DtxR family transcriptional regulator